MSNEKPEFEGNLEELIEKMAKKFPEHKSRIDIVREFVALFDKYSVGLEKQDDVPRLLAAAAAHAVVSSLLGGGERILLRALLNHEAALFMTSRLSEAVGEDGMKNLLKSLQSGGNSREVLDAIKQKLSEMGVGIEVLEVNVDGEVKKEPEVVVPMAFNLNRRGVS